MLHSNSANLPSASHVQTKKPIFIYTLIFRIPYIFLMKPWWDLKLQVFIMNNGINVFLFQQIWQCVKCVVKCMFWKNTVYKTDQKDYEHKVNPSIIIKFS